MVLLKLRLKPLLRWVILGAALFFLAKSFKDHWAEVASVRVSPAGWACLAIALGFTLLAHIFAGWVWGWILQSLKQPVTGLWSIQVYLKTNLAKYLPGNVWHFYGRITAVTGLGAPLGVATLSVLLEPLLMAAAALLVALLGLRGLGNQGWLQVGQAIGLMAVLLGLHPRVLNPVLRVTSQLKRKATGASTAGETVQLKHYPVRPLLGELVFLALRGTGFWFTCVALGTPDWQQLPLIFSGFSLAWLLGLVVPGAPGGVGVFEAVAIALLQPLFAPGTLLGSLALYRLVSTLAEALGAGLAWLDEQRLSRDAGA